VFSPSEAKVLSLLSSSVTWRSCVFHTGLPCRQPAGIVRHVAWIGLLFESTWLTLSTW